MLADLARIKELQIMQHRALIDADGALLDEIDREREAIHRTLVPVGQAGLTPDEMITAHEMIDDIVAEHDALIAVADEIRRRIGEEIRDLGHGRDAMRGYRVERPSGFRLDAAQ